MQEHTLTYKYYKIIIIVESFLFIYFFIDIEILKTNNIKICLCTVGKLENLYVREYVAHYKKYGVDKIYLYDNNELKGEKFEDIIKEDISTGFVEIINFRGKTKPQYQSFQDCLNNNYNKYNWLIFYDMDEFIYLKKYSNIKQYLNRRVFDKCESVQLNLFFHTDNDQLYYRNESLKERFKQKIHKKTETFKTIIKGNIKININDVHNLNIKLKSCNSFGNYNKKDKFRTIFTRKPDFYYNYIDHFCFKSTQEFIYKLNKGDAIFGQNISTKMRKIGWYFNSNKIDSKKIKLIEKYTKINLTNFTKRYIKNI